MILNFSLLILASFIYAGNATAYDGCLLAGSSNAPVTIVEFADFACPYCVKAESMMKSVMNDYSGRVKFVFRNLPRPAHGAIAVTAAKAFEAVCLQNPSLAFSYYTELFERHNQLDETFLFDTAKKLGVDVTRMKSDMDGGDVAQRLTEDRQMASDHKLVRTPSFMVGSQDVDGLYPYPAFKKFIDRQLSQ